MIGLSHLLPVYIILWQQRMVPGLHQPGGLRELVWGGTEPKDVTWVDGEIVLTSLPLLLSLTSVLENSFLSLQCHSL